MHEDELKRMELFLMAARKKVREHCGPFTHYYCEHFNTNTHAYSRVLINITNDNAYKALKCDIDLNYPSPFVRVKELGFFAHLHLARTRLSEETTVLEQNGFLFIDECTKRTFDIKAQADLLHEQRLKSYSLQRFFERNRNQDVLVQEISHGMHMLFVVDEMGLVWIRPVGFKNNLKWSLVSDGHANVALKDLGRIDGSLGFVGEGFFDGCKLLLTDILFIKNKWITELQSQARIELFKRVTAGLGLMLPELVDYKLIKIADLPRLCMANKALLISIPRAKPSYTTAPESDISRVIICEHEPLAAYIGSEKGNSQIEIFDFDDFSYKGLAYMNLKLDIKGLTFTTLGFRPGELISAVFC